MGKIRDDLELLKKQIHEISEAIKRNQEKQASVDSETELAKLKAENEKLLKELDKLQQKLKSKEAYQTDNFFEKLKDFFFGEVEE
ncbi:MAG: GPO family capsid scaffolding protein [Aquificae bacterium]|nr:GPO family capsid scaffolding protein [Aquificota bacterium]